MSQAGLAARVADSDPALTARKLRRLVLQESKRAHVGHIGSALSIVDIVAVLFDRFLEPGSERADRPLLVLSKGHAALVAYCALHVAGVITADDLAGYCHDGSALGVHPEHAVPGIDVSTGSLGHGLSIGAGSALAAALLGTGATTYVVMSDAELNEGSVWEAIMFAGHRRLDRLVAVVDMNGQQALGHTRDVLHLGAPEEVAATVRRFGWQVSVVDGHDCAELEGAIAAPSAGAPRMVIARTVAGHGVSYMERQVAWHYRPMSDEEYAQALAEIDA